MTQGYFDVQFESLKRSPFMIREWAVDGSEKDANDAPSNEGESIKESEATDPLDNYNPYRSDDSYTPPEDNQASWR